MKTTGRLIAGAAIAAMATGALGSGFLVLSAEQVAAKSATGAAHSADAGSKSQGKNGDNGRATAGSRSQGKSKGQGKYHKLSARILKNLNAMCSQGKSQSPNSNVYRISAFYSATDVVNGYAATMDAASSTLSGYTDPSGHLFGSAEFDVQASIDAELANQDSQGDAFDPTYLNALQDYQTGLGYADAQYNALATAVRSTDRADALVNAPEGTPEYDAYQTFLAHCTDPA